MFKKIINIIFCISVLSLSFYYVLRSEYYLAQEEREEIINVISSADSSEEIEIVNYENNAEALINNDEEMVTAAMESEFSDKIENNIEESVASNNETEVIQVDEESALKEDVSEGFESSTRIASSELYFVPNEPRSMSINEEKPVSVELDEQKQGGNNRENNKAQGMAVESSLKEVIPYNEIESKYRMMFEVMEHAFNVEIDALIVQVKEEYYSCPEEERKGLLKEFSSKYLELGNNIEIKSDYEFYLQLDALKNMLLENEHDQGLCSEIENLYLVQKKVKKEELIEKAVSIFFSN